MKSRAPRAQRTTAPGRRGGRGGGWRGAKSNWKKRGWRIPSRVAKEEEGDAEPVDESQAAKEEPLRPEQLTPEQRRAAERALGGENLFLTGAAGTGKSFLLRYLIQELEQRFPEQVAVTASTGVAASHLAGQTLHSFAGFGVETAPVKALKKVKQQSAAVKRWEETRVLIIDEISMVDAHLLDLVSSVASSVRKNRDAFGGLQVIFCGDFLQLPPVQERGARSTKAFCFTAKAWQKANLHDGTVLLRDAVRQQGDGAFAEVLNEMRLGIVSAKAKAMLTRCNVKVKPSPRDGIIPTKLYCLNRDVDKENAKRLAQLPGEAMNLLARDRLPRRVSAQQRVALDRKVPSQLSLKVGAQVIHLKNDPALGLVNGHRGCVEGFEDGKPVVRFDHGKKVCIGVHRFTQGQGASRLERFQVPLKLGWALTVHKAQGMTLTRAELQLDNVFEAGQSYVALSRLTGTQGLWIRGAAQLESSCRAHPEVLSFYQEAEHRSRRASSASVRAWDEMTPVKTEVTVTAKQKTESQPKDPLEAATLRALPGPQGKRPPVTAVTAAVPRARSSLLERLSKRTFSPGHGEVGGKDSPAPKKAKGSPTRWVTPLKHWCDPINID